jgi:hypothetical protein
VLNEYSFFVITPPQGPLDAPLIVAGFLPEESALKLFFKIGVTRIESKVDLRRYEWTHVIISVNAATNQISVRPLLFKKRRFLTLHS